MPLKIGRVDTAQCLLGEGPVWDAATHSLYVLDIGRRQIHRYDPRDGTTRSWQTPAGVGAMALREAGGAVLAMGDSICSLDFDEGSITPIVSAQQPPRAIFNDGKVDRRGRFVVGSGCTDLANPQPIGGVFSLDANQKIVRLESNISFSNAPASRRMAGSSISPTAPNMLATPMTTTTRPVRTRISGSSPIRAALRGMPDGATVDRDGLVWIAIFRGGKVVAFRPNGRVERVVEMPVSLSVSVMFGGDRLDQLFVTTIDPTFFQEPQQEGAGNLHVIEVLGVQGLPEPRYAG